MLNHNPSRPWADSVSPSDLPRRALVRTEAIHTSSSSMEERQDVKTISSIYKNEIRCTRHSHVTYT